MKTQISALISKAALLLMIISASVLMPFKIDAATWGDAPIIGVNITMINNDHERVPSGLTVNLDTDQTRWQCVSSSSTMGCQAWISQDTSGTVHSALDGNINVSSQEFTYLLYEYEIVFDKSYVGWIQTNWSASQTGVTSKTIYVNGKTARFTSPVFNTSFSITNYSLTYAPEEFIDVSKSYNFPIESYPFANQFLNMPIVDMVEDNYYNYPLFEIDNTFSIRSMWSNRENLKQVMILGVNDNINNMTTFDLVFDYNNLNVLSFTELFRNDRNNYFSIFKIEFNVADYTNNYVTFTPKKKIKVIPIYLNYMSVDHISTDFALVYGLSNPLLSDLHLIAAGNSQSNQQSQELSSGTDSMQDQMDDLVGIEDSYNQQFNNSVNSIDFTNPLQQNQGLLGASNFVITVFNGLIANNPFSILIIIVCILLIGKKVIGK